MQLSRWRLVAGVGVVAVLALTLIVLSVQGGSSIISLDYNAVGELDHHHRRRRRQYPSTTTEATTVTTTAEQRLAEVEELLRDLWFGWFDAIYRKDPDALWQVVATTTSYDAGVAAMETMAFTARPLEATVMIEDLRSSS